MPQPPNVPVISFPTPQVSDRVLVEFVDAIAANYNPIQPGTPHPNIRDFPGFVFAQQVAIPGDEKWIRRIWINERACQDTYNASLSYLEEANAYPTFTRSYIERRDAYAPRTKLQPFTGVVGARVGSGGVDYDVPPTVSFSAGAGIMPQAFAVIFRGAVVAIIFIDEGSGYSSAPTITLTAVSAGSGATATAIVQPATALLVIEKAERMEGNELDPLWLRVTRIYRTLPGPVITEQTYDARLKAPRTSTTQQTVAGANLGDNFTTIKALNANEQMVTVETVPTNAYTSYFKTIPGIASLINFPDILTGVEVYYNTQSGAGSYTEAGTGTSAGTSASLTLTSRGRGSGSAAVLPEVNPNIKQIFATNVPTVNCIFFLPDTACSLVNIKTKINDKLTITVDDWPLFAPEAVTLIATGQQASISLEASAQEGVSVSESNITRTVSSGAGTSREFNVTARATHIPPTLHGSISPSTASGSGVSSTTTGASASATINGDGNFFVTVTAGSGTPTTIGVTGAVSPDSITGTTPTTIPVSGWKIKDINGQPDRDGYILFHVELLDFVNFITLV